MKYSASKHAVEALVDGLRAEIGGWGIKVISILPGAIDSKFKGKMSDKYLNLLNLDENVVAVYRHAFQKYLKLISLFHLLPLSLTFFLLSFFVFFMSQYYKLLT